MSTVTSDLLVMELQKREFTPMHELQQIGLHLQTLESKLQSFTQFLPRLDNKRGLLNLGGTILKRLFGTATIAHIHQLHDVFEKLDSRNSDLLHSLSDQLTYVKKLNTVTADNADAIANLSNIVKDSIVKSHDTFQNITRDLLWFNVTIYGQSEMYMAARQLEFALRQLLHQIDNISAAIQCVVLVKLPIQLVDLQRYKIF
jgi:hypothetical protein